MKTTTISAIVFFILMAIFLLIAYHLGYRHNTGTFFYGLSTGAGTLAFRDIFEGIRKDRNGRR